MASITKRGKTFQVEVRKKGLPVSQQVLLDYQ